MIRITSQIDTRPPLRLTFVDSRLSIAPNPTRRKAETSHLDRWSRGRPIAGKRCGNPTNRPALSCSGPAQRMRNVKTPPLSSVPRATSFRDLAVRVPPHVHLAHESECGRPAQPARGASWIQRAGRVAVGGFDIPQPDELPVTPFHDPPGAFRTPHAVSEEPGDDLAMGANHRARRDLGERLADGFRRTIRGEAFVLHELQFEYLSERFDGLHAASKRAGEDQFRTQIRRHHVWQPVGDLPTLAIEATFEVPGAVRDLPARTGVPEHDEPVHRHRSSPVPATTAPADPTRRRSASASPKPSAAGTASSSRHMRPAPTERCGAISWILQSWIDQLHWSCQLARISTLRITNRERAILF